MAGTLSDLPKTYKAEIQLGIATDTYDASGQVTHRGDATVVGLEQVERALNSFRGVIRQKPPMYSALKVHGRRLYEIARSGDEIEVANREVQVFHLELMTWAPPVLNLEIECSKGTYIRSIAHDLGKELKCGAHLRRLIRTSCGSFSNEDSISLPQLEHACEIGYWQRFLHSMDSAVLHWTSIILGASEERLVRTGRTLMLPLLQKEGLEATVGNYRGQKSQILCRAYTVDGDFLAILEYDPENGGWHPRRVFSGCNRQPGSEHCADVYMLPVR
jgi:tRNA pseudouridine55 synthase